MAAYSKGINRDQEEESFFNLDFKKLLAKSLRNWYWLLLSVLVALLCGYFYLRYTYPMYRVSARVLNKATEEQEFNNTFFDKTALGQVQSQLLDEIQVLQARNLVAKVISDLKLHISYYSVGRVKDLDVYPYENGSSILVTIDQWTPEITALPLYVSFDSDVDFELTRGDETIKGKFGSKIAAVWGSIIIERNKRDTGGLQEIKFLIEEPYDVINRYVQNYQAQKVNGANNVIDLVVGSENTPKAIAFLNKIISYYEESVIQDKNRVTVKTDAFLTERIQELAKELRDSEDEMIGFLLENDLLVNNLEGKSEQVREFFNEIRSSEIELEVLRREVTQLLTLIKNSDADNLAKQSVFYDFLFYNTQLNLPGRDFSVLFNKYTELLEEKKEKQMSAAPGNPLFKSLNTEIDSLRGYLIGGLERGLLELDVNNRRFKKQEDSLYRQLVAIPELRIPYKKIERLLEIKEQLYFSLLQQREQIKLSEATTVSELRVLMSPRLTNRISATDRDIYMYCAFAGLLFPILLMALSIMLDKTIDNPDEIGERTDVPVIASIGHSKSKEQIVVRRDTRTAMAEMFRLLRTNLSFFTGAGNQLHDSENKTANQSMVVTSSVSGDGKTFIVVNMGMSMAIAGKKVCLVNIDLRKPKLARYLGREDELQGLSNYLSSDMKISDVIEKTEHHENLFFIPSGPIPPNPAELLLTKKMGLAVTYLKENFDVLIFDAPPIGAVADAFAMQPYVDLSLFIVRYRHSELRALTLIQNAKDEKKLPSPAIVLNDAREFQNSYSYGYGYGYGYGYYSDDRNWWQRLMRKLPFFKK